MKGWGATFTSLLVNTFTTDGIARCAASAKLPGRGAPAAPSVGASFMVTVAVPLPPACRGKSSGRRVETTNNTARTIVVACAKNNQSLCIDERFRERG